MAKNKRQTEFEKLFMPHFRAAYNLAFWLVRNQEDAEDLVQDSYLKALKAFHGFRGKEAKSWLLAIVRNTCLTYLKRQSRRRKIIDFNEVLAQRSVDHPMAPLQINPPRSPDAALLENAINKPVYEALHRLKEHDRIILVLREFEDMNYQQISETLNIPVGTVMSRISRARRKMKALLTPAKENGQKNEV